MTAKISCQKNMTSKEIRTHDAPEKIQTLSQTKNKRESRRARVVRRPKSSSFFVLQPSSSNLSRRQLYHLMRVIFFDSRIVINTIASLDLRYIKNNSQGGKQTTALSRAQQTRTHGCLSTFREIRAHLQDFRRQVKVIHRTQSILQTKTSHYESVHWRKQKLRTIQRVNSCQKMTAKISPMYALVVACLCL